MMRSLRLLPLVVVVVVVVVVGEVRGEVAVGGWERIGDVGEAHVREMGEYAVAEHDRQTGAGLAFVRVLRGETQVVSGLNYRLVLQTKNNAARTEAHPDADADADADAGSGCYEAVVWEQAWVGLRNLTSFRPV